MPGSEQRSVLRWLVKRPAILSLLFSAIFLASCSAGGHTKPDIPQSVSPGWRRTSFESSGTPEGVPRSASTECWKADYEGQGTALIWFCGYAEKTGAFDAVQRTPAEAQTAKFQEGPYLVLVKWNNVPKAGLTALIRAIQKSLESSR